MGMTNNKINISQLLNDDELKYAVTKTGCGIELVDFSMASVLNDLDHHLAEWEKRLSYIDPPRLTMHGPFLDLNPSSWENLVADATMLRYEQAYRAADILGAEVIVFHSCFVPNFNFLEGWPERIIDFYERFLDGKDDHISILMENVMDPVPDGFLEVAEGIRHPAFGICVDVGHAHCYSKVHAEDWLRVLRDHIKQLHIHDNDGTRDSHLAFGAGTLDTKKVMSLIPESASCTIECSRLSDVLDSISILG